MKNLRTRFVLIALAAIPLQAEHVHSYAKPLGQASQELRANSQSGTPAQPGSSFVPISVAQQGAPEPAIITYLNGELTIDAHYAFLSDILRAICERTGAIIPIPQGTNERVNRQIGPGPVINVLGSLLNETNFDYLIEELNADQSAPVRVVLSLKGTVSHAPSKIETSILSTAIPDPEEVEKEDAREQAISERMALMRQINDQHLQFVKEIEKAQHWGNPETH